MGVVNSGVLGLDAGGQSFATGESAKYSTQTREVESVVGGSGRLGRSTKGKAAFIETEVFLMEGQSAADIAGLRAVTVILRCEDRTVTLSNADFIGSAEVDAAKNSLTARFEGSKCVEIF
ncbi:MAG: phage tail tube protein [Alphaproteobacteria bacterium]|nr:phage tail tube protein [Alphaproteobacteria bacterium]